MWEVIRYTPKQSKEWNEFVKSARNSTFLFRREYMDYHSDRFTDFSIMAYRRGKLAAVLPANREGDTLHSHQGLTYGGWIWTCTGLDVSDIFALWKTWLEYCRNEKIEKITYKPIPYIYPSMPSEEDLYMLFLAGANLVSSDISTAIDLSDNPGFNKLQKRHLKHTDPAYYLENIDYLNESGIEEFHRLLTACLEERHEARPVHSLEELKHLMTANREISIWTVRHDCTEEIVAAVCIYETGQTAHCQYICTSPEGREKNALAFLFDRLIDLYTECGFRYFDFGTSNQDGGRKLNAGLNRQKTSYGGSGVVYRRYEINVTSALGSLPNELWP